MEEQKLLEKIRNAIDTSPDLKIIRKAKKFMELSPSDRRITQKGFGVQFFRSFCLKIRYMYYTINSKNTHNVYFLSYKVMGVWTCKKLKISRKELIRAGIPESYFIDYTDRDQRDVVQLEHELESDNLQYRM